MGLYKRYDDTALLTRVGDLETNLDGLNSLQNSNQDWTNNRIDLVEFKNDTQDTSISNLLLADINQNAINRTYLRREKSGSTTIPLGNNPVDIQYDYQVQGKLNGQLSTSDAITFTFNGNGVYLINTVVSFTDLVMPGNTMGYCILNMIVEGQKLRRLAGDHPNGNVGNLSLGGSSVLIANAGTKFKIQAIAVDSGTILGHVPEARTFLEIFQL
jgi:hypothetical protein